VELYFTLSDEEHF